MSSTELPLYTYHRCWGLTSTAPFVIVFVFGFFGSITEEGWLGLGLTAGLTGLFIAAFAARPKS
jgi:hypothetical protein